VYIDFLLDVFGAKPNNDAIVWKDRTFSFAWLSDAVQQWQARLQGEAIPPGAVVSLEADFSPHAIAGMLALVERGCIILPLTAPVESKKPEFHTIAQVEVTIDLCHDDEPQFRKTATVVSHELVVKLKKTARPGLILFSSGSTGKSKAAVHDFVPLLEKFTVPRHALRTLTFLLFDHIGGLNTLLYTLSNGGCLVTVQDRTPDAVCEAIERYRVQLLPTSPTFLSLLLLSQAYKRHDLSSLEMVTYGTEVMPESTLTRLHTLFPHINLLQTYGLSELGILRSKSKSADSPWLKVGGEGFETRVVNGMLEIKARSAMLGYLNAPSPFREDGWFPTGDAVEVDGDYIRILGRKSDIINVGGEKVYPSEVESVLQLIEGVEDVTVVGQPNPVLGQIVEARVKLQTQETLPEFRKRLQAFCQNKLPRFKVPQKIVLVNELMHSQRYKKIRTGKG
jgi:long-chain acyl-CoA synthetase